MLAESELSLVKKSRRLLLIKITPDEIPLQVRQRISCLSTHDDPKRTSKLPKG
jgi:hypothetical protein